MTRQQARIELQRSPQPSDPRRRFPWWLIPLALVLAGVAGVLFWLRIPQRAFEPSPTAPPQAVADQGGILYQSGFDSPESASNWEVFDDGFIAAQVRDGRLVVSVNDTRNNNGAWSALNLSFSDFVLDVEAAKLAGRNDNGIIVVFRLQDKENYYRFDISSDGFYSLSRARDGIPSTVSEFRISPAIQQGDAVNRIRMMAQGDSFRFWVNDQPLQFCVNSDPAIKPLWEDDQDPQSGCKQGEVTEVWRDPEFPSGRIGLGAQGYIGFDGENDLPAEATIGFDNLTIRPVAAP